MTELNDRSTLVVKGLQKSYGKRLVVRDVSLDVECGEVVGLLGPNGAGKTTSFYMIVGLVPSDAGSISINGTDITITDATTGGLLRHLTLDTTRKYQPQNAELPEP